MGEGFEGRAKTGDGKQMGSGQLTLAPAQSRQ